MNAATHLETSPRRRSRRTFLRHFVEMLLAMFVGMIALGGLTKLVFAAAGSSVAEASGSVRVLIMGLDMTVPMVAWMSYRGHPRARNGEMAASMIVPTLAAAGLAAAGLLSAAGALGVQHAAMIPAMLAVMLWRYDHYSRTHADGS
jgi:uncharacterized membrane protein YhaH (DUF805 family)